MHSHDRMIDHETLSLFTPNALARSFGYNNGLTVHCPSTDTLVIQRHERLGIACGRGATICLPAE